MTATAYNTASAVQLLAWYREMGVDCAVSDGATDWAKDLQAAPGRSFQWPEPARAGGAPQSLSRPPSAPAASPRAASPPATAQAPTSRPPLPPQAPQPARQFTPATPDAAVSAARAAARAATDLEALRATLLAFDGIALKVTAKNLCFYRGLAKARTMIIGEAPGRDEDIAGKPFVGVSGQLLDKMLAAVGLGEDSVHITNVVYWRPPGNRTPTPQESAVCRPFLDRQIELVAPEIIMLLGGSAASEMLGVTDGIMRLRGKWQTREFGGRSVKVLPALHPLYLLRSPIAKRHAWADFLALEAALGAAKA